MPKKPNKYTLEHKLFIDSLQKLIELYKEKLQPNEVCALLAFVAGNLGALCAPSEMCAIDMIFNNAVNGMGAAKEQLTNLLKDSEQSDGEQT